MKSLNKAADAAISGIGFIVRAQDTQVTVFATPDLTAPQVAILDTLVSDMKAAFNPLPQLKATKNKAIDEHTQELIKEGFIYSGLTFSLSDSAQRNVIGMLQMRDEGVLAAVLPLPWPNIDDTATLHENSLRMLRQTFRRVHMRPRPAQPAVAAVSAEEGSNGRL